MTDKDEKTTDAPVAVQNPPAAPSPATGTVTAMGTPSGSVVNTPDTTTDVFANIPGRTNPAPGAALRAKSAEGAAPTEDSVKANAKADKADKDTATKTTTTTTTTDMHGKPAEVAKADYSK